MKRIATHFGTLGIACLLSLSAHAAGVDVKMEPVRPLPLDMKSDAKIAPVQTTVTSPKGTLSFGGMNKPAPKTNGQACDLALESQKLAAGSNFSAAEVQEEITAGVIAVDQNGTECSARAEDFGKEPKNTLFATGQCAIKAGVNPKTDVATLEATDATCLQGALNAANDNNKITKEEALARVRQLRDPVKCHVLR